MTKPHVIKPEQETWQPERPRSHLNGPDLTRVLRNLLFEALDHHYRVSLLIQILNADSETLGELGTVLHLSLFSVKDGVTDVSLMAL